MDSGRLSALVLLLLGACGPDESDEEPSLTATSLSQSTAAEAAGTLAERVCAEQARCGRWSVTCAVAGRDPGTPGPAPEPSCRATHEDVDQAECTAEGENELRRFLDECQVPDDFYEVAVRCVEAFEAGECVTAAEAADPEFEQAVPPDCEAIGELMDECFGNDGVTSSGSVTAAASD